MIRSLPYAVARYPMSRTWMAVASIAVASVASILVFVDLTYGIHLNWKDVPWGTGSAGPQACSVAATKHGATIPLASALAGFGCLTVAVGVAVTRKRHRLLAASLLPGAVALAVAIGLVAAESATWWASHHCDAFSFGPGPGGYRGTAVIHFDWLYVVYGVPLALLLLRAFGAWKRVEPPELPSRFSASWETGA